MSRVMTRGQALVGWVFAIAGCWSEEARIDDTFTTDEWAFLQTEFRLPPVVRCPPSLDVNNNQCAEAIDFGRRLFFDKTLSGPVLIDDPAAPGVLDRTGTLSCAGCHDPNNYFIDTRSQPRNVSIGAAPVRTKHNAMSVLNVAYKEAVATQNCVDRPDDILCARVFAWTGKYPAAGEVLRLAGPNAMNSKAPTVAIAIANNPAYRARYLQLFGGSPDSCTLNPRDPTVFESSYTCDECATGGPQCHTAEVVFTNVATVFDVYLRQLDSTDSPFDRYIESDVVDGRTTAEIKGFAEAERRGLAVFIGKGMCIECHHGPLLSDLRFHNTGVPQIGVNVLPVDGGLGADKDLVKLDPAFAAQRLGEFLTPPLRHVEMTAPYMHAGQFDSLSAVIEFYRRGGSPDGFVGIKDLRIQPLEITDDEARDLEAFLRSLTGKTNSFWLPPKVKP